MNGCLNGYGRICRRLHYCARRRCERGDTRTIHVINYFSLYPQRPIDDVAPRVQAIIVHSVGTGNTFILSLAPAASNSPSCHCHQTVICLLQAHAAVRTSKVSFDSPLRLPGLGEQTGQGRAGQKGAKSKSKDESAPEDGCSQQRGERDLRSIGMHHTEYRAIKTHSRRWAITNIMIVYGNRGACKLTLTG
jgi:hypothetical protein